MTGGSSGGSGAAVASGMVPFASASDGGGWSRGEPGVLRSGRFLLGELVEPCRSSATDRFGPVAADQATAHQRSEVLVQGVLMQTRCGY